MTTPCEELTKNSNSSRCFVSVANALLRYYFGSRHKIVPQTSTKIILQQNGPYVVVYHMQSQFIAKNENSHLMKRTLAVRGLEELFPSCVLLCQVFVLAGNQRAQITILNFTYLTIRRGRTTDRKLHVDTLNLIPM